jgi:hypothetical protein
MFKKQLSALFLFAGALLLPVGAVKADTSYTVLVDTHTLDGTTGSIDFQFNPGVGTFQSATVDVTHFAGGAYGGSQTTYGSGGDVIGGPFPNAISITNVAGLDNEVLDSYTFANSLSFTLDFSGTAITSNNGSDTAGSLFAFSIFSDPAGTVPVLTPDPNGIALTVNLSDQGALSSSIVSPNVQITPEPSTGALLALPLAFLAVIALGRRTILA